MHLPLIVELQIFNDELHIIMCNRPTNSCYVACISLSIVSSHRLFVIKSYKNSNYWLLKVF